MLQLTQLAIICSLPLLCVLSIRNAPAWVKLVQPKRRGNETIRKKKTFIKSRNDLDAPGVPEMRESQNTELDLYKSLYHKIHNLEHHPEVYPLAHRTLKSFLANTQEVEAAHDGHSILSIQDYDRDELEHFLQAEQDLVSDQYDQYIRRRRCGGPPELFTTQSEVNKWLIRNAPVKFVDGAWLGKVHRVTTPIKLREITEIAYETLLEELGNGTLARNHVYLYERLLRAKDIHLPAGYSIEFVEEGLGMDDVHVWKAAVGQLLLPLFSRELLPETLGFNLHFELLTLGTLKAAKELPLFGVSALYFLVHISVDNAHTGHTAMALQAVERYLVQIEKTEGAEAMQAAWKRVQAGFVLSKILGQDADGLSSNDGLPELSARESTVVEILRAKAAVSSRLHCASRVKIGRQSLADWLAPENLEKKSQRRNILSTLANASPWIVKGDAGRSRLVRELSWEGKMFGAFTVDEVAILKSWIDSLHEASPSATPNLQQLVVLENREPSDIKAAEAFNILDLRVAQAEDLRDLCNKWTSPAMSSSSDLQSLRITPRELDVLIPLWFTHLCLLENAVHIPYRTANTIAASIICILQAENGFPSGDDDMHGTDETQNHEGHRSLFDLGRDMMKQHGLNDPESLIDVLGRPKECAQPAVDFSHSMLSWSKRPIENLGLLLGLSHAFLVVEKQVAVSSVLSPAQSRALQDIVRRKDHSFFDCLANMEEDSTMYRDYTLGHEFGVRKLATLFRL